MIQTLFFIKIIVSSLIIITLYATNNSQILIKNLDINHKGEMRAIPYLLERVYEDTFASGNYSILGTNSNNLV